MLFRCPRSMLSRMTSRTQGASSCVHHHRASVETLYTLLFHYQTLPGSHLRGSWSESDFLLHRPKAINLSCVDLGMFTRVFRYQSLTSAALRTVPSRIWSTAPVSLVRMRSTPLLSRLASLLHVLLLTSPSFVHSSAIPNDERRQDSACRRTKVAIL